MTLVEDTQQALHARLVGLSELVENPDNPRDTLGSVKELAASIIEIGLLQPLLVVPAESGYMVVDGHRRLAAMRSVAYDRPIPVIVTEMDRTARVIAAVSAGAYTLKLNSIERARAFKALRDEHGLTQTEIARRCGCSQATVNMSLRLLDVDKETQAKLESGELSAMQAIKHLRATARRPQGRKSYVPDPNQHVVDLTLCLTVVGSTDARVLGKDISTWVERQHALRQVPHSTHIVSVDDWSVR